MTNVPPDEGDPAAYPPPWDTPQAAAPPFGAAPGAPPYGAPGPYGAQPPPGYGASPFGGPSPYGSPPYGAQQPYVGTVRPTNGLAIASLVLGILWILWLGSALAVIFGLVAMRQIRDSGNVQQGRGLAIAGLVLGLVGAGTLILAILGAALGHHVCVNTNGAPC